MSNYILYTDSGCDISPALLTKWGIKLCELRFTFDGDDTTYTNRDMDTKTFYQKMRDGATSKTSAINIDEFTVAFEQELKNGFDLLYISFSSGLSTTYNSARIAAQELQEQYPERKIIVVDTLSASASQGMLAYFAAQKRDSGATIEQVATYLNDVKMKLGIWFTVDDLVYLKRGGRVSSTAAFVGGLLGIKPVLFMDNEGHLISRAKVRGRKAAIQALADKYKELAADKTNGTIFISHGDCIEDANELAAILKKTHGVEVDVITDIGPVIGAHSGPGTLAIFFVGNERI